MNSDRTPGTVLVLRNTDPLELLTTRSVILSLKAISLNGPFPRTAGRKSF